MTRANVLTMPGIHLRTGWKAIALWVVGLGATMLATTTSISSLYNTPAKIDSYASAVTSGSALEFINGHVYGISTLGGVIANEFGFIASFALPLMGIALVARMTRRDEESGRSELLLAGRIHRLSPLGSAVLLTAVALLLTSAALAGGLLVAGVATGDALLYAASLGGLGLVFAAIAAVAAQLVEHARGVYGLSLVVLVLAYLLRGTGAVLNNALVWLSPLGWVQETRAFADARWWPVLLSVVVAAAALALAARLAAHRDLGSAPWHRGNGPDGASAPLCGQLGFAIRLHRGSILGWGLGAAVVFGAFGALAQASIEALSGNPTLRKFMGGAGGFLSMAVLLLGLLCAACVVQAMGSLRTEEAQGRLETVLSGSTRRVSWLAVHTAVVLSGLVFVAFVGALALGVAAALSTGDASYVGDAFTAVASYLPALLVLAAVALLVFSLRPRWYALAWVVFGFTAVVTFLGEALSLPDWLMWLAPLQHVGFPPSEPADAASLAVLAVVAACGAAAALAAFHRRTIPQH